MSHIPTRHFSSSIGFEQIWRIRSQYTDEKWDYAKRMLSETQVITKSAIRVAEVIKKHFDIDLFPHIKSIACRGWDMGGGTAAFCMYGENGKSYLFFDRAERFKAMSGEYSNYGDEFYREN